MHSTSGARPVAAPAPGSERLGKIAQEVIAYKRRRSRKQWQIFIGIRLVSLALVLGAWQLYGMHTLAILFAPVTTVIRDGIDMFAHQGLGSELVYSLWTFVVGYLIGLVVGTAFGMLMGAYRTVEAAVSLYVFALYATPMVALVPIISLWIGFDATAQIVIIALFVTWPMVVTVFHGIRQIDPELLEVSRSLRLSRGQTWRHVLLPGAVPYMITGATQGVAMGLVGVIIAELQTELAGLGSALETAAQTYHTAEALAVVLVIMVLGITFRAVLVLVQRRLVPWMRLDRGDGKSM